MCLYINDAKDLCSSLNKLVSYGKCYWVSVSLSNVEFWINKSTAFIIYAVGFIILVINIVESINIIKHHEANDIP